MTASNQTYSFLSLRSRHPSSGTGMPQSMSRVMARGLRSANRFSENFSTFGRQSSRVFSQLPERFGQRRQVQEQMLGLDESRCLTVDPGPRVDQVDGIQLVSAVVALVAPGAVVTTDRAGAFDVAVRQRAAGRRRDSAHRGLRDHVAVAVDGPEQFLHHRVVIARGGPGEQVVATDPTAADRRRSPCCTGRPGRAPGTPSASACTRIGVPCSSVPETIRTSFPAIR